MGEKSPTFPLYPVLILFGVVGLLLLWLLAAQPKIPPATSVATVEVTSAPTLIPTSAPASAQTTSYSAEDIKQGQSFFQSTCFACHGMDATGIAGLGKNLVTSSFVHDLTDAELHQFIIDGRPITDPLNTTGVQMPPKGGNPSFDDHQIDQIVAYLRSLQATSVQVAAEPTPTSSEPIVYEPYTLPIAGMNFENVVVPERAFNVAQAYALSCSGCHGVNGEGGSAAALTNSALTDAQIFDLLTALHPPVDPTTGFSHPVRGEYPALTDVQLHNLIDYLHTLAGNA